MINLTPHQDTLLNQTLSSAPQLGLTLLTLLIIVVGCEDPAPPPAPEPTPVDLGVDMMAPEPDMMTLEVDAEVDAEPDPEPAPGWVTLEMTPGRTYYQLSDAPTLSVSSFDVYGDEVSAPLYHYRFDPEVIQAVTTSGEEVPPYTASEARQVSLRLLSEGEAVIEVCALDLNAPDVAPTVCARRPFIIDDSAPEIKVFWPPRGASLSAEDAWPEWADVAGEVPEPETLAASLSASLAELRGELTESTELPESIADWVPIYGQILSEGSELNAALNGQPLTVDAEGRFYTLLPTRPGYIEVRVSADDGVRSTLSVDRRWALFAEAYLESSDGVSTSIERGVAISLHQSLVDRDAQLDDATPLELNEAAQFVSLILSAIDPSLFLGAGALINTSELSLSLTEIELGEPDVDLLITSDGLSLFASLPSAIVRVTGRLALAGATVDLSGELEVGIGSYADYSLVQSPNQAISVEFLSGGVALNSLTPRLNEEAANALLEVLESTARSLVVEQLEQQLLSMLQTEIPQALELAVNDLFSAFDQVEFELSTFEGAPSANLLLNITPSEIVKRPGALLQLFADWRVTRLSAEEDETPVELRGSPVLYPGSTPPNVGERLSLQLHLDAMNALFAEMTRSGLLSLEPPVPESAQFFYSSISVRASAPPVVTLGEPSDAYPLYLELGGLALNLTQSMSGIADDYELFVRVGAQILVDGGSFSVGLAELPEVSVTLVTLNNERALINEQLIENIVVDQLWPTLSTAITERVSLGFPPTLLPTGELNQVGVNLDDTAELLVTFSDLVDYHESGWLGLIGSLVVRFE